MVEFALIAPLFLSLLFGIAEAGTFMYVYNSSQHAASVAAEVIAAEGSFHDADVDAINAVARTDLPSTGLVKVIGYDVYMLDNTGDNQRDTNSCRDSAGYAAPCAEHYALHGAAIVSSGTWPPSARNTTSGAASYVELDVHLQYQWFFTGHDVVDLTVQRFFRLEPQSN